MTQQQFQCPRCGATVLELQALNEPLKAKIKEAGGEENLPDAVCVNCFAALAGNVARGSVLMAREKAKEQQKLMLWKGRVNFVKQARKYMMEKRFSEAASAYEKYIRVLEVIYDCKPGELTPEMFKDSARTKELTVVTSTFWDLVRIYDTSDSYGNRLSIAVKKLAQFVVFTPILPDIVKKAETFHRSARHPKQIKNLLKDIGVQSKRCFIATAAFDSEFHPVVFGLRQFRDHKLRKTQLGSLFIQAYEFISPPIARFLDRIPAAKPFVRWFLSQLEKILVGATRQ